MAENREGAMPEHEARIAALITRWRNGAASSDGEWEQCDQAELLRCADELEALLTAGEDVPLQGEPDFWRCRTCGCLWRDNHDDSVSLCGSTQVSCRECEMKPTRQVCEPLFRLTGEASLSCPLADIALCTCQVISGGAVSLNLSCPLHGISLGHKLSAPMASGLLLTLKSECEAQHARAELAEHQIATLTAERDSARELLEMKRAALNAFLEVQQQIAKAIGDDPPAAQVDRTLPSLVAFIVAKCEFAEGLVRELQDGRDVLKSLNDLVTTEAHEHRSAKEAAEARAIAIEAQLIEAERQRTEAEAEIWEDVLRTVRLAWSDPGEYLDSPLELIVELIEQRDDLQVQIGDSERSCDRIEGEKRHWVGMLKDATALASEYRDAKEAAEARVTFVEGLLEQVRQEQVKALLSPPPPSQETT